MRIHIRLLGAACALAFAGLAGAQALKPGLWEVESRPNNAELDGAMAQMRKELAAMPPEQRKQMEAMMAAQGVKMAPGAGGGMAVQVCMTREMVERSDIPLQDGCRVTRQQRSGKTMKMAYSCSKPPSSGEGEVTFTSPASYTSRMTVRSTVEGRTETMTMSGSGKWLGADCGSIMVRNGSCYKCLNCGSTSGCS